MDRRLGTGGQRVTDDPETKSMPPSDRPSVPSPRPASFQLSPGDKVGNYVIREQIGEGGFAIVYAAEQEKPVRRKVALKIIKLGMDTKQVIARFEAEGQALAMMDHPNVAKVFDAGATETGRPYFVMEYVAGTRITEHCDRQRLSVTERLEQTGEGRRVACEAADGTGRGRVRSACGRDARGVGERLRIYCTLPVMDVQWRIGVSSRTTPIV
jgi:hypothetical protein